MICYFPPLCCVCFFFLHSSFHFSPPLPPLPVTRRWRSGCQRCGGRGEDQRFGGSFVSWAVSHAPFWWQNVTMQSQFPRQSRCGLCSKMVNYVVQSRKKKKAFQILFTANFESAILVWCRSGDKLHQPGGGNNLSPDMKTTACSLVLNESVLLFFHQGFRQWDVSVLVSLWDSRSWITDCFLSRLFWYRAHWKIL